MPFGWKLTAVTGLFFGIVFICAGVSMDQHLEAQALRDLEASLFRQAGMLSFAIHPDQIVPAGREGLQTLVEEAAVRTGDRVTVVDVDGRVLADSAVARDRVSLMENHKTRPEIQSALSGKPDSRIRKSATLKKEMFYAAYPVRGPAGVAGVIRLSMEIEAVENLFAAVRRPVFVTFMLGLFLVMGLGALLGRSFAVRFSKILSAASRYAQGDLSEKILIGGDDELKTLAHSLNLMVAALKRRIGENESEKSKLAAILGSMEEGVLAVNRDRRIVLANASAEEIFEISPGAATGKSLISLVKKPRIDEMMAEAVLKGTRVADEIELLRDETKHLRVSAVGMGETEDICGILVLSDITHIRRLEKMRRDFVANVSHELRTPLTSIRGFVETLLGGAMEDPASREKFLRIMEDDTRRLGRLIDDLLELSRLEARQAPLNLVSLDIADEAKSALESFEPRLVERGLRVQNHLAEKRLPFVRADRDRIRQVLINLIDNAIKFNREQGSVILGGEVRDGFLRITVEDTGIGIPAEAVGRAFERFFRVDKARSREAGGTGLGLAIVKHIVESHGGEVFCSSVPDKGTKFSFTLPLRGAADSIL